MHVRRVRTAPRRGGSVVVLCAILLVPLMGMVAFAIDIGYIAVVRSQLQRAADSCALAGAAMLIDEDSLSGVADQTDDRTAARIQALAFAVANDAAGSPIEVPLNEANDVDGDLVLGYIPDRTNPTQMLFNTSSYNGVRVRLRRDDVVNGPVNLFFSSVLGLGTADVTAEAIAMFEFDINGFRVVNGQETATAKLLPFTLQIDDWNDAFTNGDDDYAHDTENQTVSSGSDGVREIKLFPLDNLTSGNFGTVDLGAPNNSTADLARQIIYGLNAYDFSFFPNNTVALGADGTLDLNGDTGISAGMKDELESIIGQPRIIPLYDTVSGNGNNSVFVIKAFVGITILKVKLTGALSKKHVLIQPCTVVDGTAVGGGQNNVTSSFVYTPLRLVQ